MSAIYDNWERLVSAVKKRKDWEESACRLSRNTSFGSSSSDLSDRDEAFDFLNDPEKYIIEERNGKMCYMAGVRQLLILTRRASQFWDWTARADSRFSEVVVLHYGRCLDIRGRIKTRLLSAHTYYAAYLVFKLTVWSEGLQSVEAVVNFFDKETNTDAQERAHTVYLQGFNKTEPHGVHLQQEELMAGWKLKLEIFMSMDKIKQLRHRSSSTIAGSLAFLLKGSSFGLLPQRVLSFLHSGAISFS